MKSRPVRDNINRNQDQLGEQIVSAQREQIIESVRDVIAQHAHLTVDAQTLPAGGSLYSAGMTSHASVNVMLGVEDVFDVEFPEELLTKETFESLDSIAAAVESLQDDQS